MYKYEITLVIEGKNTPAKQKSILDAFEKLVEINKGKITKTENWGKKDLAYPIKKSETGIYVYLELDLDAKAAKNIAFNLNSNDDILRYLVIRND